MIRTARMFVPCLALFAAACAGAEPVTGEACGAARTVLVPVINAVIDEGGTVELETRTALVPPASDTARWEQIRDFGFAPVWRSPGTDTALRTAYWDAWRAMDSEFKFNQPDAADRQAWAEAYRAVGDDRIFPADDLWAAFLERNLARADFTCAAALAQTTGADLVSAQSPRERGAMRLTPAAPGLEGERALMAASALYPPFEAGDPPRETGTIWLLRFSETGGWRVLSARRVESMGGRRLP